MRRTFLRRRMAAAGIVLLLVLIPLAVMASGGGGAGAGRGSAGARPASSSGGTAPGAGLPSAPRWPGPPLSAAELAGQRIIYAYSGLEPPALLLKLIRRGEAAGVILFGSNVATVAQVRAAVGALQRANRASPVRAPLLILTDQEGGQVRRLPGPPVLSEGQIGHSPGARLLARQAGAAAASVLAAAGVNVNLAPVLDVARQPGNFIDQFQRSYGPQAGGDAQLGAAFIEAQQRLGVAATAKHFPGLGAARRGQDTDSRPVTLRMSPGQLRGTDEMPYRSAIAAGVKLIMTSWAVYPALDGSRPAGLSPRVIQSELRGRLGFAGVTISDTLSAGALSPYGTLAQRGVLAARAGADLLICSAVDGNDDPTGGLSVLRALVTAMGRGQLSRDAALQAAARVLALRHSVAPG